MLNRKILIVDDNVDIHNDFIKILNPTKNALPNEINELETQLFESKTEGSAGTSSSGTNYVIDSALQGSQALDMVEEAARKGEPYALLFVDVRMPPGWDGVVTIKEIWKKFPHTEMVLCTAYSTYSSEELIGNLGESHRLLFIKKPFDPIAIKQMALAVTTKWNLEEKARNYMNDLEASVKQRTQELQNTVGKLADSNRELDLSLKKLSEAQSQLIQTGKMTALGEMVAGIAHEINNPLCIIEMNVTQLQDNYSETMLKDPEISKIHRSIERTIGRISHIINGLRAFSRDVSNDPFEETKFQQIMCDALVFCSERLKYHGVDLKIAEIPESLKVECRSTQLSQVVANLLMNSFDAIQSLSEKWIRVDLFERASEIELSVTDSGHGISEKNREKLFQPFFTTKDVGKGCGLGLSTSRGIAKEHQGSLNLDCTNVNTRFVLIVPKVQKL